MLEVSGEGLSDYKNIRMGKDMLPRQDQQPTVEELRQLPRWARVAFAAKCARRVQPLLRRFWVNPDLQMIEVFERVIELTEQSAARMKMSEGLIEAMRTAEAYEDTIIGTAQKRPYGGPSGKFPVNKIVRAAVAHTAVAAAQSASAAEQLDDDASAAAALDAYGWASHAALSIHVSGADRVMRFDLTDLQRAAEAGKLTDSTPVEPTFFALEKELRTYRRELPRLLAEGEGKFAIIHDQEVAGTWDTYEDALQAGFDRYQLTPFLVKKIAADALD